MVGILLVCIMWVVFSFVNCVANAECFLQRKLCTLFSMFSMDCCLNVGLFDSYDIFMCRICHVICAGTSQELLQF